MHTLTVNTPSHAYPIFIGSGLLEQADTLLKPYLSKSAAIISNETVAPLYLHTLQTALDKLGIAHFSIILPDGEQYKNWPNPQSDLRRPDAAPSRTQHHPDCAWVAA
jgi:3-dehydroquinate synthase